MEHRRLQHRIRSTIIRRMREKQKILLNIRKIYAVEGNIFFYLAHKRQIKIKNTLGYLIEK